MAIKEPYVINETIFIDGEKLKVIDMERRSCGDYPSDIDGTTQYVFGNYWNVSFISSQTFYEKHKGDIAFYNHTAYGCEFKCCDVLVESVTVEAPND